MPAPKVRADHNALAQLAKSFGGQSSAVQQTLSKLKRQKDVLHGGDWVGKGADKFYAEFDSAIIPSLNRLSKSLERAQQVTLKISQIMQQADDDIARLFRTGGDSGSLGAAVGAAIGAAVGAAVGGALGGPVGAAVGAVAGAEAGSSIGGGGSSSGGGGSSEGGGGSDPYEDTFSDPKKAATVPIILDKAQQLADIGTDGPGAEQLKDELLALTTHGSGERAVIGKGGEVPEWVVDAKKNGGFWYENPPGYYEIVGPQLAWEMNQRFLQRQLESGIPKIDYVGETVEQVLTDPAIRGKTRWREVQYLMQNAGQYGYELQGNSWVKVR